MTGNKLSQKERKNMDAYLAKIRGETKSNSSGESEKRKRIRVFFFPLSRPDELDDGWWDTLAILILIGFIGGIILAFITNNSALGLISFFGGSALMVGLDWLDREILGISKKRTRYAERKEKRDKLLEKWGLREEDFFFSFDEIEEQKKSKQKIIEALGPVPKSFDFLFEADQSKKPSVSMVDTWLKEDMQKVINRALDKLGLTREELVKDPMVIYGPLFWTTDGIPDDELVTVKITDGTLRFSCYQLVVVCLSAERIATYSANFNFLRNVFVGEKTIEFLYRDIVSVSTEEKSTNYNLPNGSTMRRAQVFRLVVPGDNIEVVINSPEIKELLGGEAALTDHDRSVRVIREMLRDKKG